MSDNVCVLCGKPYSGLGNNPWPAASEGRCCDKCNMSKVVPARLNTIRKTEDVEVIKNANIKIDLSNIVNELRKHDDKPNVKLFISNINRIFEGTTQAENMRSITSIDNNLFKYQALLFTICVSRKINPKLAELTTIHLSDTYSENEEEMFEDNLKCSLYHAHVFHVSENVKQVLLNTKNKIHYRKLPFPVVFIDSEFDVGDTHFYGVLLVNCHKGEGLEISRCVDPSCPDKHDCFHFMALGSNKKDHMAMYDYGTLDETGWLQKEGKVPKTLNVMAEFICNFLDFLHDPRVQYVKSTESGGSSHRHLLNLYRSRKIDLDKTYFIRIENPLRQYVDSFVRMSTMHGYSHMFWVRGHFRTLHSQRYGENIGKKLWINPFTKGMGMLIEKKYDVEKGKVMKHGTR